MAKIPCAIIGSGNIGTDLMIKVMRTSKALEMGAMVGIDPTSDGLARAKRLGVPTTHEGIEGLRKLPNYKDIRVVFDATSAGAHIKNNAILQKDGKKVIDLTPAAIGPFTIPVINGAANLDEPNVNMVTCGGQATIPMVYAVKRATKRVIWGEIVASISSKSAGPGTRANIDEFTETTSKAICALGGAERGKAIIILNPAEPPLIMRDTVFTLSQGGTQEAIEKSVAEMVAAVQKYVPGYRLKQKVQFEHIGDNHPVRIPGVGPCSGLKTTIFLEVEGAAHYLPACAGNLDAIEICHGDGITGATFNYGFGAHDDGEWIAAVAEECKNAVVTVLLLPGIGTVHDLKHAHDAGARSVRIATHCTEADVSKQHIEAARALGMDTVGFRMMAHMAPVEKLVEQAKLMEAYGAECVYV